jgi:hypothetical protein
MILGTVVSTLRKQPYPTTRHAITSYGDSITQMSHSGPGHLNGRFSSGCFTRRI